MYTYFLCLRSLINKFITLLMIFPVLEPACEEYNELQEKFNIEKSCRTEAELHASKVHTLWFIIYHNYNRK